MQQIDPNRDTSSPVFQELGTVQAIDGDAFEVRTASGTFAAKRALSCSIMPAVHDRVIVAVPPEGALYILAILERESDDEIALRFERDVRLDIPKGRLAISAQEGIDWLSQATMRVVSSAFEVHSDETHLFSRILHTTGEMLRAEFNTASTEVGWFDSVFSRVTQKVEQSIREVTGLDRQKVGQLDMQAKESIRMHSRHAFVQADELVKVDGDQIHFG